MESGQAENKTKPPKPASCPDAVITDSGPANSTDPHSEVVAEEAKPASEATQVITDSDVAVEGTGGTEASAEPSRSPSASACEVYRDTIEVGFSQGRNAKAIWQDLVNLFWG